jgi:hypothetical protein
VVLKSWGLGVDISPFTVKFSVLRIFHKTPELDGSLKKEEHCLKAGIVVGIFRVYIE